MAAAATVPQIAIDFRHGRLREAGQMKEDDEGIPFHTLLTAGTHRGDRILRRKIRRRVWSSVLGGWHSCSVSWWRLGTKGGVQEGPRQGAARAGTAASSGVATGGGGPGRDAGILWCTSSGRAGLLFVRSKGTVLGRR
jgi:hypothetical protein